MPCDKTPTGHVLYIHCYEQMQTLHCKSIIMTTSAPLYSACGLNDLVQRVPSKLNSASYSVLWYVSCTSGLSSNFCHKKYRIRFLFLMHFRMSANNPTSCGANTTYIPFMQGHAQAYQILLTLLDRYWLDHQVISCMLLPDGRNY